MSVSKGFLSLWKQEAPWLRTITCGFPPSATASKMTSEFAVGSCYWPSHSISSDYLKEDDFSGCWPWQLQLRAGETNKLLMMGALKRQAGHWFCSWQTLCQRSQPRPYWLMVWYLLKAKIVSKRSTPSQQEQEHLEDEKCTYKWRDAPLRVTVDAYLLQPSPSLSCCFSVYRPYVTASEMGDFSPCACNTASPHALWGDTAGRPRLGSAGERTLLYTLGERGKAAGMPTSRSWLQDISRCSSLTETDISSCPKTSNDFSWAKLAIDFIVVDVNAKIRESKKSTV